MDALLERMLPGITARPNGLGQALLRGRYMAAVARMERTGVPIDSEMMELLRSHWGVLKLDLIGAIDKDYGVYEGVSFKSGLFVPTCPRTGSIGRAPRTGSSSSTRTRFVTCPSGTRSWSR